MKRATLWLPFVVLVATVSAFAQLTAPGGPDNSPKVGEMAPDFPLSRAATTVGAESLQDLIGKKRVLLAFFPGAFTRGCTVEFTEAGQMHDRFVALNIEMIGISRDLPGALSKFKETVGAQNGFLSDPELTVAGKYDAISPGRVAKRYYFLIDETGRIVWKSVNGSLIPTEKLLADLEQVLSSSGGQ